MDKEFDVNNCTLQEACDYAVLKIVGQGDRCMVKEEPSTPICAYSDGEGNHCAVGWLLDKENKSLMGYRCGVVNMSEDFKDTVPKVVLDNQEAFSELQRFHDATYRSQRYFHLDRLSKEVDTSAPQYQEWIDMGECYETD